MVAGIADLARHRGSAGLHRQVSACRLFGWQEEGHIDVAEIDHIQTRPPAASTSPGSATRYCTRPHAGLSVRCHRYLRQCAVQWLCGFDAGLRLNDIGACRFYSALEAETWAFADSSAARALSARRDRHPAVAQK